MLRLAHVSIHGGLMASPLASSKLSLSLASWLHPYDGLPDGSLSPIHGLPDGELDDEEAVEDEVDDVRVVAQRVVLPASQMVKWSNGQMVKCGLCSLLPTRGGGSEIGLWSRREICCREHILIQDEMRAAVPHRT